MKDRTIALIGAAVIAIAIVSLYTARWMIQNPYKPPAPPDTTHVNVYEYANASIGFSLSDKGPFTRPGPTISVNESQPISWRFAAVDNITHVIYIDVDDDGVWEPAYEAIWWYLPAKGGVTVDMKIGTAGSWHYRDTVQPFENYGTFNVIAPPKPWFRWDPFFIFSFGLIYIILPGYAIYVVYQAVKYQRSKSKMKSADTAAWVKCIQDPNGPMRPSAKDMERYR